MKLLPTWVLTNRYPAIYDSESATVLEMTAKLYGAMNELITEYNTMVENVNQAITDFETGITTDFETFKTAIRQEFQNFIEIVDLKIEAQNQTIQANNAILKAEVQAMITTLQTWVTNEVGTVSNDIADLEERFNEYVVSRQPIFEQMDNRITANEGNILTLQQAYEVLAQKDEEIETRCDGFTQTDVELYEYAHGVGDDLAQHKQSSSINFQVQENKNAEQDQRLTALEAETTELYSEVSADKERISTLEGRFKKLWENENPTSLFAPATISVGKPDNLLYYHVQFQSNSVNVVYGFVNVCIRNGEIMVSNNTLDNALKRIVTCQENNGVVTLTFGDCSPNLNGTPVVNVDCVPIAIYGVCV